MNCTSATKHRIYVKVNLFTVAFLPFFSIYQFQCQSFRPSTNILPPCQDLFSITITTTTINTPIRHASHSPTHLLPVRKTVPPLTPSRFFRQGLFSSVRSRPPVTQPFPYVRVCVPLPMQRLSFCCCFIIKAYMHTCKHKSMHTYEAQIHTCIRSKYIHAYIHTHV